MFTISKIVATLAIVLVSTSLAAPITRNTIPETPKNLQPTDKGSPSIKFGTMVGADPILPRCEPDPENPLDLPPANVGNQHGGANKAIRRRCEEDPSNPLGLPPANEGTQHGGANKAIRRRCDDPNNPLNLPPANEGNQHGGANKAIRRRMLKKRCDDFDPENPLGLPPANEGNQHGGANKAI